MFLKKALKIMTQTLCGTLWCHLGKTAYPTLSFMTTPKGATSESKVHDHTAAPIVSFQAGSAGEGSTGRNMPLF